MAEGKNAAESTMHITFPVRPASAPGPNLQTEERRQLLYQAGEREERRRS
jgi:hypothetical protein